LRIKIDAGDGRSGLPESQRYRASDAVASAGNDRRFSRQ
jgi:hypothetical protein